MKYRINAGAIVVRKHGSHLGAAAGRQEKITTTQDVVYTEDDVVTKYTWPLSSRIKSYVFRLPNSARPWTELEVFPKYIHFIDDEES
jgi:hypothetical protein